MNPRQELLDAEAQVADAHRADRAERRYERDQFGWERTDRPSRAEAARDEAELGDER